MKKRMFWGKYVCPVCGKCKVVFTSRGYNSVQLCFDERARIYHMYGENAPRKYCMGFIGTIICKKCGAEFVVDQHESWLL